MSRARFVAEARREFIAEVTYFEHQQPGLGSHFSASVENAIARALAFPDAGIPATRNTRRVFLKDFPFAIVYRPDSEGIIIFALAHHSRRPGYWQSRVHDR